MENRRSARWIRRTSPSTASTLGSAGRRRERDISQFGGGDADKTRICGAWRREAVRRGCCSTWRSVAQASRPFAGYLAGEPQTCRLPRICGTAAMPPPGSTARSTSPTVDEDLSTKRVAQGWLNRWCNLGLGALPTRRSTRLQQLYASHQAGRRRLVEVLIPARPGARRHGDRAHSDRGEMGAPRRGEETSTSTRIRAWPGLLHHRLFPEPRQSVALVSHVDLLADVASLIDAGIRPRRLAGRRLLRALAGRDPSAPPVHLQDHASHLRDLRCAQTCPARAAATA